FGSKADMCDAKWDVRFTPRKRTSAAALPCANFTRHLLAAIRMRPARLYPLDNGYTEDQHIELSG
ncbi:MAG: hypothetical protein WB475_15370, partial [Pseudolabrys sp.]